MCAYKTVSMQGPTCVLTHREAPSNNEAPHKPHGTAHGFEVSDSSGRKRRKRKRNTVSDSGVTSSCATSTTTAWHRFQCPLSFAQRLEPHRTRGVSP